MDTLDSLPEDGHYPGIHQVSSGEFHVVGIAVRRDVLKYELSHIGILSFIALKREIHESYADNDNQHHNKRQEKPAFRKATLCIFFQLCSYRHR